MVVGERLINLNIFDRITGYYRINLIFDVKINFISEKDPLRLRRFPLFKGDLAEI